MASAAPSIEQKVLTWMVSGDCGESSTLMALISCGLIPDDRMPPSSLADLNRCFLLVEQVPEVKEHFHSIAAVSPKWRRIIDAWDQLQGSFVREGGLRGGKEINAPQTLQLFKSVKGDDE